MIKLIEECPQDLWGEKAGGWPVWQHVAHASSGLSFFCPGDETPKPEGLNPDAANLKIVGTEPVERKVILGYFKACQAKAEAFIAGLTDADLPGPNAKTKAIGLDWTITTTLVILSSHLLYHLGNADALLRGKGHKGIF
jgi:hypothetical protein